VAAGLRDLLALQGVAPVSYVEVPVSAAGAVSWGQLSGVWVNGSTQEHIDPEVVGGGGTSRHKAPRKYEAPILKQALREDEEILLLIQAYFKTK
jgi:hypothetical protein